MAELRYITIPADILAEDISPIDSALWSWCRCVEHLIRKDSRFNENGEGIRAGAWILKQLKSVVDGKAVWLKKAGDELAIDQAYWRLLHDAFEKPMQPALAATPSWHCAYMPMVHLPVPRADGTVVHLPAESPPGVLFVSYIDAVSDEATKKRAALPATPGSPSALPSSSADLPS
jgi:hypothetical protein